MTPEQLQTLRAHIDASPDLANQPAGPDGAFEVAALLNLSASPAVTCWRASVSAQQVMENGFVWTAVDGLTAGKARIWDWLTRYGSFDPSKVNVRQGLADCFGANSAMVTAILPHLKRSATRAENLFASGVGSDASPKTLTFEGDVSYSDVMDARAL